MKKILSTLSLILALALCLTACGGGKSASGSGSADLQAVLSDFKLGDEMMTYSLDELNDILFMGFDPADVKQCAAAMHTSGINCDEIIMIEAANADAAGRVKAILDERYQTKLNETDNYLPEENAIIKKCSVTQNGNYVAMIVAPNAAELTEIYNKSFK